MTHLTPEEIIQYAEEFSHDPGFMKVEPNGRDRASYLYKALMLPVNYFDCIEIAGHGWTIAESRLVPCLLELRADGIAKTKCATQLGVSLGQVNRWLARCATESTYPC